MNNTAVNALLANNNNKTTDANNMQERGDVVHGGRTTRPEVTTGADDTQKRGGVLRGGHTTRPEVTADVNDTQERGGISHGGRMACPEVTTDADNTQQRGGVAHGGHDGAADEGATTAALGTTRPDFFDLTGNTQDVEDSHIKKTPVNRTSIRS